LHRSEVDFLSSEIPGEDGLKVIEKQLALRRPATVRDVDGHEVVLLFERWLRGNMGARIKLIRYCQTDILTTYLTAGLLLQKMGFDHPLPDAGDIFSKIA